MISGSQESQESEVFHLRAHQVTEGKTVNSIFFFFFCIIVVMFKISAALPSSLSFSYEKVKRSYSSWLLPKLINAGYPNV